MSDLSNRLQPAQTRAGNRRAHLLMAGAWLGWAVCFDGAMWAIRAEWLSDGPIRWLVAALPSVAALLLLVIYTRYLRHADELQRLIQLQAMRLGFGGGFFIICGYLLFEQVGAPVVDKATLASLMPVLFAIGILVGWRRYR